MTFKKAENKSTNLYKTPLFIGFFLIMMAFFSGTCFASLLNQEKGKGIFIPAVYIQSMNSIDEGNLASSKRILQAMINVFAEYGVSTRITLGAKMIATGSMSIGKNPFGKVKEKTYAINSREFFGKFKIIRNSKTFFLSAIAQIGMPTIYDKRQINYFGIDRWAYETGLEFGIKFSNDTFMITNARWHGYINYTYNEVRTEIMFGHYFIPEMLTMIRFQKFFYIKNHNFNSLPFSSIYDFNAQDGFGKITISMATPIDKNIFCEIGFFASIKSKITFTRNSNISLYGGYVSLWYKF